MGRKKLDASEKKVQFNIRVKRWIVDEFKSIDGYGPLVESLLEDYLIKKHKNQKED